MTAFRHRLATPDDAPAIAAITNHYIRTTAIHFAYQPVPDAELAATLRADVERYPWLVAAAGTTVLAYAKAGPWRTRTAYQWIAETGIYVDRDHLGQGLGTPLYRRLLAVMTAQGFHAAIGGIALPNPASVALHERLGFRPCGVVPRAGRKFDRWHDVGFWWLALREADHAPAPLLPPAVGFAATEPV